MRRNHLFAVGHGDCEYCGAKPWESDKPCVEEDEEEE